MDPLTATIYFVARLVLLGIFISLGYLIIKGMLCLAALFWQVAKAAVGTNDDTVVTFNNSTGVEGSHSGTRLRSAAPRGSSFFEDAGGLDLEYRGVGVAEDRRAASVLGSAVPQGAGRGNRSTR